MWKTLIEQTTETTTLHFYFTIATISVASQINLYFIKLYKKDKKKPSSV